MIQNLKNDLVNIMLLGVLLFGLMLAQDSGWGFLLASLPLAIWTDPTTVDISCPHDEACSKASGLTPPRWL